MCCARLCAASVLGAPVFPAQRGLGVELQHVIVCGVPKLPVFGFLDLTAGVDGFAVVATTGERLSNANNRGRKATTHTPRHTAPAAPKPPAPRSSSRRAAGYSTSLSVRSTALPLEYLRELGVVPAEVAVAVVNDPLEWVLAGWSVASQPGCAYDQYEVEKAITKRGP
jgi:hypothetical protein